MGNYANDMRMLLFAGGFLPANNLKLYFTILTKSALKSSS